MNNKKNYEEQHINDVNIGVDELFYPSKKKLLNNKNNSKIKIIGKRFNNLKKNKNRNSVMKKTNIETTKSGLIKRKIELKDESLQAQKNNIKDLDDDIIIGINNNHQKCDFEINYDKFSKNDEKINMNERKNRKKVKNKIRKAKSILVLLIFIAIFIYFITSPIFNVNSIEINDNKFLSSDTYISLSKIELNKNIYKITKKQIKDNIKENAYVEDVIINRVLPNKIVINVQEREPKYMIEYMGSYMYIDNQGNMLDLNTKKLDLPILLGISTENINVGEKLNQIDIEKIDIVSKILEVAKSYQINEEIDKIVISNSNNYTLYL